MRQKALCWSNFAVLWMYRAVCTGSLSLLIIRLNAQGYSWSTGCYRLHAEENKQHHRCTRRISFSQTHQTWGENSQHFLLKTFGVVHIEAEWLCRQQQSQHGVGPVSERWSVKTDPTVDSVCFFGTRWSLLSFGFLTDLAQSHCATMVPLWLVLYSAMIVTIAHHNCYPGWGPRCWEDVISCLRLQVPLCRGYKPQIHFDGVWWKMLRVYTTPSHTCDELPPCWPYQLASGPLNINISYKPNLTS